jgi:NYN domain
LDRCALFVDASYALAGGALAVHGTRHRDSVSWDYAGLLKLFGSLSRDRTGLPLLRCYWYDTVGEASRAAEHDALADIPGVKIRLSKIRPGRKEGVEAEIRKDLTALARNHAVSDVVIVSAEEDLAPAIAEVQDLGVRTILLHIASDGNWAVSRSLRQECDDIIDISAGHLRPFVDLIAGAEPHLAPGGYRERAASPAQTSAPQQAIEAPATRLYASPVAAAYERVEALAVQPPQPGQAQHQMVQPVQPQPPLQQPVQPQQFQPVELDRGPVAVGGGEIQSGYPAGVSQGQQGYGQPQPGLDQSQIGYGQPGQSDYRTNGFGSSDAAQGPNGQVPAGMVQAHSAQATGQPGPGQSGPGQAGLGPALVAQTGASEATPSQATPGQTAPGQAAAGHEAISQHGFGHSAEIRNGVSQRGSQADVHGHGAHSQDVRQHGGLGRDPAPANGSPVAVGPVLSGGDLEPNPLRSPSQQLTVQPGSGHEMSSRATSDPASRGQGGLPHGDMGQVGIAQGSLPQVPGSDGFGATGFGQREMLTQDPAHAAIAPQGQLPPTQHSQQAGIRTHRAGSSQPGFPATDPGQLGLAPLEPQRPAPQRQLPPGNGIQYPPENAGPYGSALPARYAEPQSGMAGYPGGTQYGGPQPAPMQPPPMAISIGEAVQSAHAEGFGFGEAVARDAPALWLEAVLARKPRMPSDLEARLLQGSALPIDSLLHDEVRHALRRGFWDALERSRR